MSDELDLNPQSWRRPTWLALLVVSSVAFTFALKCATPFAAFAVVAACTLPRRDAYGLTGAVWLANQAVGFACLDYPWTLDCVGWGLVFGVTAFLSTATARLAGRRLEQVRPLAKPAVIFLAAFAAYEATLIGFSLMFGGIENYTLATQGKIFALNAAALVGLLALDRVGSAAGLAPSKVVAQHA